jgi:hypothetical protein
VTTVANCRASWFVVDVKSWGKWILIPQQLISNLNLTRAILEQVLFEGMPIEELAFA